jgi:cytochrome c peroxidase
MKPRLLVLLCGIIVMSTLAIRASQSTESPVGVDNRQQENVSQASAFDCGGEPCDAVLRGFLAFGDRRLRGLGANGRACADCHMPTDHFQLSPADAEARFQLLQLRRRFNRKADDPLFLPIDADDFRTNGENAADFSNLRQNGLIRIVFGLPSNIRLIAPGTTDLSDETLVDVWRAVPTVNDVALTGPDGSDPVWARDPNRTGGYQLDARMGSLQQQALGALVNHAQAQNTVPQQLLDDLSSFQRVLFTNHRVRALSDAIRAGTSPLPDPDPSLNALEEQGKVVFARACAQCHGGPGQSTPKVPVIRFHDIATQCPRPVDTASPARFLFKACPDRLLRNTRTYEITQPNGTKLRRTSSDPGRALTTGIAGFGFPAPQDDWNKFDTPALRGIKDTAPYFHNNSADTLEEVVDHYIEFFKRVKANTAPGAPIPPVATTDGINFDRAPLPEERESLLAYLRKL